MVNALTVTTFSTVSNANVRYNYNLQNVINLLRMPRLGAWIAELKFGKWACLTLFLYLKFIK